MHNLSFYMNENAEIRPYMYETLMYLVVVHAQVSDAAEPLLERTLNSLAEELADEALRCFRQVKRFGMGGMLRVSNFIKKKLGFLLTRHGIIRQLWKLNSCTKLWGAM